MGRVKIRDHNFDFGNVTRLVHHFPREALFLLGSPKEDERKKIVVGIGIVRTIEKGQDFDLVGMDFGGGFKREIFVKNNHARRQIYTLKKSQYAWFYGIIGFYNKEGKPCSQLYAKAFQGWFVPKNIDIKKVDPNEIERLTEENESKINFIDEILGDL